jgi:hypothetical protein
MKITSRILMVIVFCYAMWAGIAICREKLAKAKAAGAMDKQECVTYLPPAPKVEEKPDDGPYHIKMYNGGQLIGEWVTKQDSLTDYKDGVIYFVDALTGMNMAVKGDGIITDYAGRPAEVLVILDGLRAKSDIPH